MFKAIIRMLFRKKQHTLLNVIGLTLGITTSILVGVYVKSEYIYDSFHLNSDRIYRINQSMIWGDWNERMSTTGPNVAIALKTDVPEIEAITRVLKPEEFIVSSEDKDDKKHSFLEENLLVADPDFFTIFSFTLIEGDKSTALAKPYQIVITEDVAKKHFDKEPALGKTLVLKGTILESNDQNTPEAIPFTVSGIVSNVPSQSHIQFDMVASSSSFSEIEANESTWAWTAFVNYVLVKDNVDIPSIEQKLQSIPVKWAAGTLERLFGKTFDELHANNKSWNLYLQPLEEVYLGSARTGNILGPLGDLQAVRSFSAIGILILIICSINFINLSTAQSSDRAREVGIRKVLGAQRGTLIGRFLLEAISLVAISTILSIFFAELLSESFNHISGKTINITEELVDPIFLIALGVFCGLLGLLAGTYPAFFLSSFQPLKSIKGTFNTGFTGKRIRNALVIFQFTITIALIISTAFIKKQLNYVSQFNLGYDSEHIIQLHNIEYLDSDVQVLKNTLLSNSLISAVGQSHQSPPNISRGDIISASRTNEQQTEVSRMKVDASYLDLLNVKLIAGRNFDEHNVTDIHNAVILNVSAVQALGWGTPDNYDRDSPIGKYIYNGRAELEVIGVTTDFHFKTPKFKVGPLVVYNIDNKNLPDSGTNPSLLSLKINSNSINSRDEMSGLIASIKYKIHELDPFFPLEHSFLDQEFESSFRKEQHVNSILNAFTIMALIIACLGLYGLAAFSAEQRTRELSIRKVLGAGVTQIMIIFSRDFTKLVIVGFFISAPIAWFFVDLWLANFAYRTPINGWVFVFAGFAGILISWVTIGFQSFSVAKRNPAETLKEE
jgi:putative ABC transport system permease protein